MTPAVLAIVTAILQAVLQFLPQIPELITLVKNAGSLLTQTTPITADQEAAIWADLVAAHNALQAAGGPAATALAPIAAQAPAAG